MNRLNPINSSSETKITQPNSQIQPDPMLGFNIHLYEKNYLKTNNNDRMLKSSETNWLCEHTLKSRHEYVKLDQTAKYKFERSRNETRESGNSF